MAYIKSVEITTHNNEYRELNANRSKSKNNAFRTGNNGEYEEVWSFYVTDYNENIAVLDIFAYSPKEKNDCIYKIKMSFHSQKGTLNYETKNIQPFSNISEDEWSEQCQCPADYRSEEDFNNACIKFLLTQLEEHYDARAYPKPTAKNVVEFLMKEGKGIQSLQINRVPF